MLFCKKGVLTNFAKFTRKHQKRDCGTDFSCEFCEISYNIFFKEPFGQLLQHKHSVCCPICLSKNDVTNIFWLRIYFGLICRLGTRLKSIFQALSQKPIFNPVEHLRLSFFAKIVNSLKLLSIFAKKAPL